MDDPEPAGMSLPRSSTTDRAPSTKRYFFDVHDGDKLIRDDAGIDLSDVDAVPAEAYGVLRQLFQDRLPDGHRTIAVRVRDEAGTCVYAGEMTIRGKRYEP